MINLVEFHVVDHCNLNCRGCAHFAPVGGQWFAEVEEFKTSLSALSRLQTVKAIRLMGGEPFLHPRLFDFVSVARDVLGDDSEVRVMTNGQLLRDGLASLITFAKRVNLVVEVTRYPAPAKNVDRELQLLTAAGVDVRVVNVNVKTLRHHRLDVVNRWPTTSCVMTESEGSLQLRGGVLYRCPITAYVDRLNAEFSTKFTVDPVDVLDLSSATVNDVENFTTTRNKFCGNCAPCEYGLPFTVSERKLSEWTVSE